MRSTITDTGRDLLARLELGEISMEFCEVRTGNGVYSEVETITGATSLKSEKNIYHISSSEIKSNGFLITAGISNVDGEGHSIVQEAYRINELGVYVSVDGVKYLYMIAVQDGDTGNVLPVYNGNNAIDFVEKFMMTISNTANVIVNMSGAYALSEDVLRWIGDAILDHAEQPSHITDEERIIWNDEEEKEITFSQDGSTITETTSAGVKTTVFNQDGSITETYPDGRSLVTTFNVDGSISRTLVLEEEEESEEDDEEEEVES